MTDEKNKHTLNEMWQFIDSLIHTNQLVPDKSVLSYDEVFAIYSKLVEFDQVFREILQMSMLKKELNEETTKEIIV